MRARPDPVALVDCRGRAGVLSNRVVVASRKETRAVIAVVEHRGKVSAATRRRLREVLTQAGLEPASWIRVPKARKATAAVAEAVRGGADTVLVCGGDGTVRAAAEALVDTGVALAVLPTGTANLFAAGAAPAHRAGGRRRTGDLRPAAGRGHRPLQRPDLHGDGRGRSGRGHDRRDR